MHSTVISRNFEYGRSYVKDCDNRIEGPRRVVVLSEISEYEM